MPDKPSPGTVPSTDRELRAANRARVRRILQAALIHDLKAPLNTATLLVDLLGRSLTKEDAVDPAARARLAENVDEIRRELRRISEALPGLSSLPEPGEEPSGVFDLVPRLGEALDLMRQQILLRGARLHRHLPEDDVVLVRGRPSDLQHAVLNLVLNALEAMPRGGELTVRLERDPGGSVTIRIEDSGPGIRDADVPRLFQPRACRRDGHDGLGLAVARGILEEHGGTLRVASRQGGGTVATLVLPAVESAPVEPVATAAQPAARRPPETRD